MADTDEKGRGMSACSGCGSIVSHEWKCGACAANECENLQKELDRLRQALQLFWTRWNSYEHLSEKEQLEIAALVGDTEATRYGKSCPDCHEPIEEFEGKRFCECGWSEGAKQ